MECPFSRTDALCRLAEIPNASSHVIHQDACCRMDRRVHLGQLHVRHAEIIDVLPDHRQLVLHLWIPPDCASGYEFRMHAHLRAPLVDASLMCSGYEVNSCSTCGCLLTVRQATSLECVRRCSCCWSCKCPAWTRARATATSPLCCADVSPSCCWTYEAVRISRSRHPMPTSPAQ